ncbi:hypothetical protein PLICRDRAFT_170177 [Plicaturopsis crispa FD-325 SS-3]|nr:hypothetical protein PLICRDRAFT_170177 [Plicaturopsis crispa FD-325 SS-3]
MHYRHPPPPLANATTLPPHAHARHPLAVTPEWDAFLLSLIAFLVLVNIVYLGIVFSERIGPARAVAGKRVADVATRVGDVVKRVTEAATRAADAATRTTADAATRTADAATRITLRAQAHLLEVAALVSAHVSNVYTSASVFLAAALDRIHLSVLEITKDFWGGCTGYGRVVGERARASVQEYYAILRQAVGIFLRSAQDVYETCENRTLAAGERFINCLQRMVTSVHEHCAVLRQASHDRIAQWLSSKDNGESASQGYPYKALHDSLRDIAFSVRAVGALSEPQADLLKLWCLMLYESLEAKKTKAITIPSEERIFVDAACQTSVESDESAQSCSDDIPAKKPVLVETSSQTDPPSESQPRPRRLEMCHIPTSALHLIFDHLDSSDLLQLAVSSRSLRRFALPAYLRRYNIDLSRYPNEVYLGRESLDALDGLRLYRSDNNAICRLRYEDVHVTRSAVSRLGCLKDVVSRNFGIVSVAFTILETSGSQDAEVADAWAHSFESVLCSIAQTACTSLSVKTSTLLPSLAVIDVFEDLASETPQSSLESRLSTQSPVNTAFSTIFLGSPLLFLGPLLPWSINTLRHSPLTDLTIDVDLSSRSWALILPMLSLPLLTTLDLNTRNLTFGDLLQFLRRHPSLENLTLSRNPLTMPNKSTDAPLSLGLISLRSPHGFLCSLMQSGHHLPRFQTFSAPLYLRLEDPEPTVTLISRIFECAARIPSATGLRLTISDVVLSADNNGFLQLSPRMLKSLSLTLTEDNPPSVEALSAWLGLAPYVSRIRFICTPMGR